MFGVVFVSGVAYSYNRINKKKKEKKKKKKEEESLMSTILQSESGIAFTVVLLFFIWFL